MNRIRKAHILGVGVITPALTGIPQAAAAHSVDSVARDIVGSVTSQDQDAAKRLLQDDIFSLTPSEKLKIGGDRIRLSEGAVKNGGGNGNANKTIANWTKQYCKPPGTGSREAAPGNGPGAGNKAFLSIVHCHSHAGCEPTINRSC
jgi:hypothetical protein